jgi:hypothetical protein
MEIAPAPDHEVSHAVPAADAAALSLVFLLFFCVVCFALGAAILGRRERNVTSGDPGHSTDEMASATKGNLDKSARPPADWERDSDWWKTPR